MAVIYLEVTVIEISYTNVEYPTVYLHSLFSVANSIDIYTIAI